MAFVNREIWDSPEGAEINILPGWSLWGMLQSSDVGSKVPNLLDLAVGKQSRTQCSDI